VVFLPSQRALAEHIGFPKDFLWCVATAAHEIEGYNFHSDWWWWEQMPGHPRSGAACDHWNRVGEDIELIRNLGAKGYRLSIEWAKIEPMEDIYDPQAIAHYRQEIQNLLDAGITPIITLQHFTFPLWVKQKGGWEWEGLPQALGSYAKLVYREIAPEVRYWVTINEPMNYILGGYFKGVVPPGEKRKLGGLVPVLRGVLKAHAKMYQALHLIDQRSKGASNKVEIQDDQMMVGMALQLREMHPYNAWNPLDHIATHTARRIFNWTLPDAMESGNFKMQLLTQLNTNESIPDLEGTQDFLGINFYGGDLIKFSFQDGLEEINWDDIPEEQLEKNARPQAFYHLVKEAAARYPGKPILILENGIDDDSDLKRPEFIREHLRYLAKAIDEGAPVKSYCHWSLLDNFEWNRGFVPRFGLYRTDYSTFERTPRASARLFKEIANHNGFDY
jgi:beta-glucosidase